MKIFRLVKIISFTVACFFAFEQAFAGVSFSIKNEDAPRTKILFFGFDSNDPQLRNDGSEIIERIKKNLKTTDLFEVLRQSGQLETTTAQPSAGDGISAQENFIESLPNFEKYNKIGIGAIVVSQLSYDQNGNLEIRIRMWDVLDQRQLFGKFYSTSRYNYKKMSNVISDEIFKAITGEKIGHFDSRILYVSESGGVSKRTKRISLIDFDGENHHFLTDGKELVLTPIFSKKPNEIFYLRYFENRPQIFSLDLGSLRSRKIGGFNGTTFATAINPKDSNVILLSVIIEGNSDIYELNISENTAKRLTKSPAIDTTPSYSPDGKTIAFVSDRDSGQQIYVMDASGTNVRRVSSGSGSYSKPMWSPDGRLVAFTKIKGNRFYIGVMSPNGKGEKLLTSSYLAEGAKWSPNGRYLIYSKKRGPYGLESIPRLFVVDIITGFEFEVPTPINEGATDPDWM